MSLLVGLQTREKISVEKGNNEKQPSSSLEVIHSLMLKKDIAVVLRGAATTFTDRSALCLPARRCSTIGVF